MDEFHSLTPEKVHSECSWKDSEVLNYLIPKSILSFILLIPLIKNSLIMV